MANFQVLECLVALGGDTMNVVHRGEDNPVTFPELMLLQYVHGEDAVTDAFELGTDERDNGSELDRLRITYGSKSVQDVFPGTKPRLPTSDGRIKARRAPSPPKRKPLPSRDVDADMDTLAEGE